MPGIKNVNISPELLIIKKSVFVRNDICDITFREPLSFFEALWPNLVAFGVFILYLGIGLIPIIYFTRRKINYAVMINCKEQSKTLYISKEEAAFIKEYYS